jgi:hypothetical protein
MTNQTVDLMLALLLAVGSTIGAQIGARASRRLRGEQLMILLAVLCLVVVGKMAVGLAVTPSNLLDVGHGMESRPAAHATVRAGLWPPAAVGRPL